MKKPLWSIRLGNWTCGLIGGGTFVFWVAGFLTHYAPLYTLYWPLPADFAQFSVVGGTVFILGIALVMLGTAFFVVNIYMTIGYTPAGWDQQPTGALLASALGLSGLRNLVTAAEDRAPGVPARGGHRPGNGGHRAQRGRHPLHGRADPRLHGGGAASASA